jgi:hypothetical protein
LYHYTQEYPAGWKSINPGNDGFSYFTTDGQMGKIQAALDLALPTNKIPHYRIEIITSDPNFNFDNIQIIRQVTGNVYGHGGGGIEILYKGSFQSIYGWKITILSP